VQAFQTGPFEQVSFVDASQCKKSSITVMVGCAATPSARNSAQLSDERAISH
jgi:hypothetical protein